MRPISLRGPGRDDDGAVRARPSRGSPRRSCCGDPRAARRARGARRPFSTGRDSPVSAPRRSGGPRRRRAGRRRRSRRPPRRAGRRRARPPGRRSAPAARPRITRTRSVARRRRPSSERSARPSWKAPITALKSTTAKITSASCRRPIASESTAAPTRQVDQGTAQLTREDRGPRAAFRLADRVGAEALESPRRLVRREAVAGHPTPWPRRLRPLCRACQTGASGASAAVRAINARSSDAKPRRQGGDPPRRQEGRPVGPIDRGLEREAPLDEAASPSWISARAIAAPTQWVDAVAGR